MAPFNERFCESRHQECTRRMGVLEENMRIMRTRLPNWATFALAFLCSIVSVTMTIILRCVPLVLVAALCGGCAMVLQKNQDETGTYSTVGFAVGKGNINALVSEYEQVVEADGSMTTIGQSTDSLQTDMSELLGEAIRIAITGATP